jgi:hypothetical protein
MAPLKLYLLEVDTIQPLVEGEEAELLRDVWNQDEHQELASWRLIEANLHLVVSIAKRHASAGRPVLDLDESGNSGLIFALQTFAKGAPSAMVRALAGSRVFNTSRIHAVPGFNRDMVLHMKGREVWSGERPSLRWQLFVLNFSHGVSADDVSYLLRVHTRSF